MRSGSFLGGVALALFTTLSAQAADLGVRPAVPQPRATFRRPIIGPDSTPAAKSAAGRQEHPGAIRSPMPPPLQFRPTASCSAASWASIRVQMGPVVAGIEGNFDGTWFNGSTIDAAGNTLNTKVFWTSTLTGRLGYAFDRLLIYARGGAAFAYDRSTETQAGTLLQGPLRRRASAGPPAAALITHSTSTGLDALNTTTSHFRRQRSQWREDFPMLPARLTSRSTRSRPRSPTSSEPSGHASLPGQPDRRLAHTPSCRIILMSMPSRSPRSATRSRWQGKARRIASRMAHPASTRSARSEPMHGLSARSR